MVAALLAAAAACGADDGTGDTTGTGGNNNKGGNQNPPTQPGGTPVAAATVDVLDDYYSPNSVLLAANGTVTWNWIGYDGHSVTPDDTPFAPTAGVSYPPKTLVVNFPTAGDYRYFCTTHGVAGYYSSGTMIGTIFVR